MNAEDYLQRLLPYRLEALAILDLMLEHRVKWGEARPMQVFVDGKLKFEGTTNLLTNPVFEAGVMHARALLEFMGLKSEKGVLVNARYRGPDDAAIERIEVAAIALRMVSRDEARASLPEAPDAAEAALAGVIEAANKGIAHYTFLYPANPVEAESVAIAAKLTRLLVDRYVYVPLGRSCPVPAIWAGRSRDG